MPADRRCYGSARGLQRQPRGGNVFRACAMLPALTGNIGKPGAGFYYLNDTIGIGGRSGGAPGYKKSQTNDGPALVSQMDIPALLQDPAAIRSYVVWNCNPLASNPNQASMEKGLALTTDFASANLLVQTDKVRLQHSLLNILTNAIKFTERGSILIGYKAVYFRRRLCIEIFIRDTGRGMSAEFQKRLFQEFTREDDLSEKEPRGTGLGLVIVKRMIEKLGGEITFESESKEGSEFFIRLPLRVITD